MLDSTFSLGFSPSLYCSDRFRNGRLFFGRWSLGELFFGRVRKRHKALISAFSSGSLSDAWSDVNQSILPVNIRPEQYLLFGVHPDELSRAHVAEAAKHEVAEKFQKLGFGGPEEILKLPVCINFASSRGRLRRRHLGHRVNGNPSAPLSVFEELL